MNYLFLTCMDNGGSRFVHRCFAKCSNAVTLNVDGIPEQGQIFFGEDGPDDHKIRSSIWSSDNIYYDPLSYNWPKIKQTWHSIWDDANINHPVYIENCPLDITRVPMLCSYFRSAKFIFMWRNPFAQIESKYRTTRIHVTQLAQHWLRVKLLQEYYASVMAENVITITYEDCAQNNILVKEKIIRFVPALNDLDFSGNFQTRHLSQDTYEVKNYNQENINRLSSEQIADITKVLKFKYSDGEIEKFLSE